jgi:hypothetical protein
MFIAETILIHISKYLYIFVYISMGKLTAKYINEVIFPTTSYIKNSGGVKMSKKHYIHTDEKHTATAPAGTPAEATTKEAPATAPAGTPAPTPAPKELKVRPDLYIDVVRVGMDKGDLPADFLENKRQGVLMAKWIVSLIVAKYPDSKEKLTTTGNKQQGKTPEEKVSSFLDKQLKGVANPEAFLEAVKQRLAQLQQK